MPGKYLLLAGRDQNGQPVDIKMAVEENSKGETVGAVVAEIAATSDTSTAVVESMLGGSHQPVAVSANSRYKINPEIDCFYKVSAASALYRGDFASSSLDAFTTGVDSNLAASNMNLASSNLCFEFYAVFKTGAPILDLFAIGDAGANAYAVIDYIDAAGVVSFNLSFADNTGTLIGIPTSDFVLTGIATSNTIQRHVIINIDRTTGAGLASVTIFVDGTQILNTPYTDTGAAIDMTALATGSAGIGIQRNGTVRGVDAIVSAIKVYNTILSLPQIVARTDQGAIGNIIDLATNSLLYWVNFQNGTGLYHPDANYGNLTYSSSGSPAVGLVTTGSAATPTDSDVVWAKSPIEVNTGSSTYLNLYTRSGNSGDVSLTKV